MRWQLDDNARSGLHYLLLGVAVVGMLTGVNAALDHLYPGPGPQGCFGHGYLLDREHGPNLVAAGTGRGERLATVVCLAFAAATALAGSAWSLLRRVFPRIRRPVIAAWWVCFAGIVVAGGRAALLEPPVEWVGQREGALIIWRRAVLLNDVPLPGGRVIELVHGSKVDDVAVVTEPVGATRKRVRVELRMKDGATRVLGNSGIVPVGDSAVTIFAEEQARSLRSIIRDAR